MIPAETNGGHAVETQQTSVLEASACMLLLAKMHCLDLGQHRFGVPCCSIFFIWQGRAERGWSSSRGVSTAGTGSHNEVHHIMEARMAIGALGQWRRLNLRCQQKSNILDANESHIVKVDILGEDRV